mmetsp:Transcript_44477/g.81220  ORF Transcript_44477/g.81220 Transcript_44477/m.81220 type:complete len:122 (+) Transcript_44477:40-405(+)
MGACFSEQCCSEDVKDIDSVDTKVGTPVGTLQVANILGDTFPEEETVKVTLGDVGDEPARQVTGPGLASPPSWTSSVRLGGTSPSMSTHHRPGSDADQLWSQSNNAMGWASEMLGQVRQVT